MSFPEFIFTANMMETRSKGFLSMFTHPSFHVKKGQSLLISKNVIFKI